MSEKHEWPLWLVAVQGEPAAAASLQEWIEEQREKCKAEVVSRVLDPQAYAVQVGRAEVWLVLLNLLKWSKEEHDGGRRSESRVNGRAANA